MFHSLLSKVCALELTTLIHIPHSNAIRTVSMFFFSASFYLAWLKQQTKKCQWCVPIVKWGAVSNRFTGCLTLINPHSSKIMITATKFQLKITTACLFKHLKTVRWNLCSRFIPPTTKPAPPQLLSNSMPSKTIYCVIGLLCGFWAAVKAA